MSKRILLMYISEVSGHHSATLAIENAMKLIDNSIQVMNVNSLSYTSPVGGRIINRMYMRVVKSLPNFWGWMYDNPKVISFLEPIKRSLHKRKMHKIDSLMKEFRPDAVVFSQAYPCGMFAHYKQAHNLKIPLIAVLTDFAPHSYWVYDEVDFYIVPSKEASDMLVQKGVNPDKIKLFGIPIDPKFSSNSDKEILCKKFGMDPKVKVILIMGGGHGLGHLDKIARELDNLKKCDFQMIVVAGINKKIVDNLHRIEKRLNKKLLLLEFTNNINELMDVADIIITKAGGLTTAESLAKGLAMIVINPIPGQEVNNQRFLVDKQIAVSANNIKEVVSAVKDLIQNQDKLSNIRLKAKDFGKPRSSLDIAKFILEL